jgi:hypothetical protein
MSNRLMRNVSILLLLLLWSHNLQAQGIATAIRAADPRLSKPITFSSRSIALGDLLAALSHQTNVPLSMDPQSGAFYIRLAVSLKQVPLGEALDGIWSLLSYQEAAWAWQRSGDVVSYHYELVRPPTAERYAAQMNGAPVDELQKRWMLQGDEVAPGIAKLLSQPGKVDDPRLHDWPTYPNDEKREFIVNGVPVCPLRERLPLLTKASGVSVLALRPEDDRCAGPGPGADLTDFYQAPFGMTVGRFVTLLERYSPYSLHKFRRNLLLLSYPDWTAAQELPGPFVAQLRKDATANGGYLPVSAISRMMAKLTQQQIDQLTVDFQILKSVSGAGPIYALYNHYPEIIADTGSPITPEVVSALKSAVCIGSDSPLMKCIGEGKALAIRLREHDNPYNDRGGRYIEVEFLDDINRWRGDVAFWSAPPLVRAR